MTSRIHVVLATTLLLLAGADAKSYGSSGGGFSSRPSTSFSSKPSYSAPAPSFKPTQSSFVSKPSSPAPQQAVTPKPVPQPTVATKPAPQIVPGKSTFVAAPVAVAGAVASTPKPATPTPTAVDAKLARNTALTGKTYVTKADAEVAYKNKLAAEATQYKSSTPPATRPSDVPQYVSNNGQRINVTYNHYGSGGYGYGYYSPTTHLFVALVAADMILNAQRQADMNAQYQQNLIMQQQLAQQQRVQDQILQQQAMQQQYPPQQTTTSSAATPQEPGHSVWFWILVAVTVLFVLWLILY